MARAQSFVDTAGNTLSRTEAFARATANAAESLSVEELLTHSADRLDEVQLHEWADVTEHGDHPEDELRDDAARNLRGSMSRAELLEDYLGAQSNEELLR